MTADNYAELVARLDLAARGDTDCSHYMVMDEASGAITALVKERNALLAVARAAEAVYNDPRILWRVGKSNRLSVYSANSPVDKLKTALDALGRANE